MGGQWARIRLKDIHSWVLSCPAAQPHHRGPGLGPSGDRAALGHCRAEGSDTTRGDVAEPAPGYPTPGQRSESRVQPGLHRLRPGVSQLCPAVPRLQVLELGESWVPTVSPPSSVSPESPARTAPSVPSCAGSCPASADPAYTPRRLRAALSTSVHQDHSPPRPACCPGPSAMLAHRERTWRTPWGAGSRQHSGPVSGGGPGKATPKEALRPSSQPWAAPGPSPPGGQSLTQVLLRSPTVWPLRVFTPLPQLWGLGHPRQPWCPGPQQDPQKPVGPVGSTFRCVHSLRLPAVTLSLSARGTGPRAGQRFRAALTKLLSWEWATRQTSGPALVSPGRWLDTAGHPSNLFSVWQCLALPPPPDRKALKPQASSGDSCSLSLTAKPLPAWLPALPHPTHRPGGPQRVLAESGTVLPRGRVPSTPSLVHHPGTLHGAWAGATVRCRPRCSP